MNGESDETKVDANKPNDTDDNSDNVSLTGFLSD